MSGFQTHPNHILRIDEKESRSIALRLPNWAPNPDVVRGSEWV